MIEVACEWAALPQLPTAADIAALEFPPEIERYIHPSDC
jgi:hypothetical protein